MTLVMIRLVHTLQCWWRVFQVWPSSDPLDSKYQIPGSRIQDCDTSYPYCCQNLGVAGSSDTPLAITTRRTFNLSFLFNLSTTYQFCKYIIYKILHSWWKNSLTTVILYNGSQSRISNCNHRMIIFKFVAINYLELELQLDTFLPLLVAGWGLTRCRLQMNNPVGKLMIENQNPSYQNHQTLQWHKHLHPSPAWKSQTLCWVMVVLMWRKRKKRYPFI